MSPLNAAPKQRSFRLDGWIIVALCLIALWLGAAAIEMKLFNDHIRQIVREEMGRVEFDPH